MGHGAPDSRTVSSPAVRSSPAAPELRPLLLLRPDRFALRQDTTAGSRFAFSPSPSQAARAATCGPRGSTIQLRAAAFGRERRRPRRVRPLRGSFASLRPFGYVATASVASSVTGPDQALSDPVEVIVHGEPCTFENVHADTVSNHAFPRWHRRPIRGSRECNGATPLMDSPASGAPAYQDTDPRTLDVPREWR